MTAKTRHSCWSYASTVIVGGALFVVGVGPGWHWWALMFLWILCAEVGEFLAIRRDRELRDPVRRVRASRLFDQEAG